MRIQPNTAIPYVWANYQLKPENNGLSQRNIVQSDCTPHIHTYIYTRNSYISHHVAIKKL